MELGLTIFGFPRLAAPMDVDILIYLPGKIALRSRREGGVIAWCVCVVQKICSMKLTVYHHHHRRPRVR